MANLTITVDEEVLKRARLKALEQGTSVNAMLRRHLEQYASGDAHRKAALATIREVSRRSRASRGKAKWTREELHERRG